MSTEFDVIIVGAGPAGIFAALELTALTPGRIPILEKGADLPQRLAGLGTRVSGWGGAGAFSDGKLNLSADVGGNLARYLSREELVALMEYVDGRYLEFGAPKKEYGADPKALARLQAAAACHGLSLIPTRHLGTERCPDLLARMRDLLCDRVEVRFGTEVVRIDVLDGVVQGVGDQNGVEYRAPYVILAAGRYTSRTFDDRVRTFCMCPYGEVLPPPHRHSRDAGGHGPPRARSQRSLHAPLWGGGEVLFACVQAEPQDGNR